MPFGRGTYGSRSMHVGGNALKRAADAILEKAKPMAALMMEAAADDIEFKEGRFRIVGTDRAIALIDVAKAFYRPVRPPPQFDLGLEASGYSRQSRRTIKTAAMPAKWRLIRKPAGSRSRAMRRSMTSAKSCIDSSAKGNSMAALGRASGRR